MINWEPKTRIFNLPAAPVKWYNIELPEWVFKVALFTLFIMVVTLIGTIFGEEMAGCFMLSLLVGYVVS